VTEREEKNGLAWQSKAILLMVVPWTAVSATVQARWWWTQEPVVAYTTLGICAIFGLIVWRLRAGTPAAAAAGAAITASAMFATVRFPYENSWMHGLLMPLLAVFLLTFAATKIGKAKKERLGTGEGKRGRNAAQVAANVGVAALAATLGSVLNEGQNLGAILAVAALAEAAADTVSSEIGQVYGGQPRMLTSFRRAAPGTDGGVTIAGTAAGVVAAAIVAAVGIWAVFGAPMLASSWTWCCVVALAGVFGLLFDSLLGATLESKGWLNNDSVNFLSTLAAAVFSYGAGALLFGFALKV
jgi:uncharacterized protein (TIGR00297 family)